MRTSFLKAIFFSFFCILSLVPFVASAGSEHNMSGYAWSSNIGWISFNNTSTGGSTNYGVTKNIDGTLVGYAWSSNIGWIQFGGLSGFPTGAGTSPQNAQVVNGDLIGWVRALSNGGGWDGWISLSGSQYGVVFSNSKFTGYAWGGSVVGWVKFDAAGIQSVIVGPAAPSGSITASDCTIASGASTCSNTNVTWTTSNLTAGATEVTRNNPNGTSVSILTSGTNVDNVVNHGESTFYLYHNINGVPTVLAFYEITAECVLGTAWDTSQNPARCAPIMIAGYCNDPIALPIDQDDCFAGIYDAGLGETPTQYRWTCEGMNGGADATCVENKFCGDGVVDDALGEECDAGSANSNFCGSPCDRDCNEFSPSNLCVERPLFIEE